MKKEILKPYLEDSKRVRLLLKNSYTYTGYFLELLPDCIRFKDKFGDKLTIDYNSIVMVTELEDGEEEKWKNKKF